MQQEAAGFELLVTADKNLQYQQNLTSRKISIVVLGNAQCPVLRRYVDRVVDAVNEAPPGSYAEVDIPFMQMSGDLMPVFRSVDPQHPTTKAFIRTMKSTVASNGNYIVAGGACSRPDSPSSSPESMNVLRDFYVPSRETSTTSQSQSRRRIRWYSARFSCRQSPLVRLRSDQSRVTNNP